MTKVTNISPGPRGLHTSEGLVFIDPYQVWEGEIEDVAMKAALATGWFAKGEKKAPGDEGDSAEIVELKTQLAFKDQQITELQAKLDALNAAPAGQTSGYEVKNKGGGYYVVLKDGVEVTKSLRKDDVAGFDEMSEEDRAALVELHKVA